MRTSRFLNIVLPAAVALLATACAGSGGARPDPAAAAAAAEQVRGREQLIRAFDAGWIRVIEQKKDQEILRTEPPNRPGAASLYMVRLADCLPAEELAPFPEQPVGLFREILERGTIRRLVQDVPNTPEDTAYYFSGISEKYLRAVLDEIGAHYGVRLEVEDVALPPGPLPSTTALVDGRVDFVGQLNATGGETEGLRRRTSRRFSCTMSASSQYVHIPNTTALASEINTFSDLEARPEIRVCAGPLTTQTAKAFLPRHKVTTKYVKDLSGCVKDIEKGKADVIINPLPSLQIAGINGFKSVHTLIVAGTPLWVAREGILCEDDGNPRTDDCRELDPP